jgi:hypothetical protein
MLSPFVRNEVSKFWTVMTAKVQMQAKEEPENPVEKIGARLLAILSPLAVGFFT